MAFSGLTLTSAGRAVLAQAQAGKTLSFAYVAVGDGTYNGSFTDMKTLKHQLYTVNFGNLKVSDDGTCVLEADITNQGLEEGYYLREIGIFVKSGEDDALYLYDNAGNDAEYINASEETVSIEKRLRFQIQVSGVEDITLSQQSVLYLPQKDFEDFVDHGNISNTVIDYTVPEREEEPEPGEKTGSLVGKIVKKLSVLKSSLSSHTGNKSNPHGVTKTQVGLGNVDNTADKDKPISTATQQAIAALNTELVQLNQYVHVDNIQSQLTMLGYNGNCWVSKRGHCVTMSFDLGFAARQHTGDVKTIFTIPKEYAPISTLTKYITISNGINTIGYFMRINPNGNITIQSVTNCDGISVWMVDFFTWHV